MKITKHAFVLLINIACSLQFCFGQVTFRKEIISAAANISETKFDNSTGYITTGWYNSLIAGNEYIFLIKTDLAGDTIWSRTFAEPNGIFSYSLDITSDSGLILTGLTNFNIPNGENVYLAKTNYLGDTLWTNSFGGTDSDIGRCVRKTIDKGYIIAGETNSFGTGNDIYVLKTDSTGNLEWSKTFGLPGIEQSFGVCSLQDSGFAVIGTYNAFSSNDDIVLIRLNSQGDTLWCKAYGGYATDIAYDISQTQNNGFAIIGTTLSFGAGMGDVYCIVTDSIGNIIWSMTYGSFNDDGGRSITPTLDGGFLIGGITSSFGFLNFPQAYAIKINSIGHVEWSKVYTSNLGGEINSILQSPDGGYFISSAINQMMKSDSTGTTGCDEQTVLTKALFAPTQLLNNAVFVTTPNTTVWNSSIAISSGIGLNTICTNVGLSKTEDEKYFSISPNPTSGNFNITFATTINKGSIDVYNTIGTKLHSQNIINANTANIQLKNFAKGIYFVKVNYGQKQFCKKIVVE